MAKNHSPRLGLRTTSSLEPHEREALWIKRRELGSVPALARWLNVGELTVEALLDSRGRTTQGPIDRVRAKLRELEEKK